VHGFVATCAPITRGRSLIESSEWDSWRQCIITTIRSTAIREGDLVNWPVYVHPPDGAVLSQPLLMQFCHGAPGFVICLAEMPTSDLDDLLIGAGEAIWRAGPLTKGANLCHGTTGNGYAFLKLYQRTEDVRWLERARAFAMHAIGQMEAHARHHGHLRYSLWTGDLGVAIYLSDCIDAAGRFPTSDEFFCRIGPAAA